MIPSGMKRMMMTLKLMSTFHYDNGLLLGTNGTEKYAPI
jgi:hypothetical protein